MVLVKSKDPFIIVVLYLGSKSQNGQFIGAVIMGQRAHSNVDGVTPALSSYLARAHPRP